MNSVQIAGYVGSISLAEFDSGEMLKLRVATTHRRKAGEEWIEETEWHSVTVWGSRAAGLAKVIKPGRFVGITGTLRTRQVEGDDGATRYFTEVVASEVTLGPPGKGGEESPSPPPKAPTAAPSPAKDPKGFRKR